ncbi:prominin 1 b isoform X12 [Silurus meridionalis]|uniref:prominin 1 b isoform X12 n=1 Tax=Silurus meridionalis TaxID=175797 RepID=UPI001EECACE7|nr:prominin 1 b isoform X12 [Silurus meridionalis]
MPRSLGLRQVMMMMVCWWSLVSGAARPKPESPHLDTLDFGFVPAVVYDTHAYYEPGAVDVLFHIVHAFLYTVQPNPFPADLIVKIVQQDMNGIKAKALQKPENIVLMLQAMYYEIGFILLAALGVMFVLLMPLVGLLFCLCRCCENCGGEMHQRHRKNADCQRGFYTLSLITSSVFITMGVLVAYTGSHNITSQIKSTKRLISSNIKDLKSMASYTPAQIEYLTAQYTPAKNKVLSNIHNIGPLLGEQIHNQLDRDVMPALDNVLRMAAEVKALLDKSGAEISNFINMFPVESALENFTRFLTEVEKDIEEFYPKINQYDFYRWIGCVVLCCMVVLILAFNLFGLMCGICGHDKNSTPTTRGCLSNTGGNLLMVGVGFSFMFSWVLMGVVVTTFVTGGNVEKLVCEPLASRQLFKIIDAPYIVHPGKKNVLPGMLFQNPNINLTIGSLYNDCYENNGIYSALQLENQFHFIQFINTTVNNHDLAEIFEGVNVDLEGIILLAEEGKDNLINFANAGLGEINYESYLSEVNKGVTVVDLLSFANELEAEADHLPRGALGNALKGHASSIRQIHKEQVLPMEQAMKFVRARSTLSQSIRLLQTTVDDLPSKVTNVLNAIDAAEYLIANNASHVVKKETDKYTNNLMGYLKRYVTWVQLSLMVEVAQCKPISNIIDSLEIVGCSFIVDSVNTFWFGLGGCCLFLIPSIIMSIKLAKFYRRMDTEDVFDDGTENWS